MAKVKPPRREVSLGTKLAVATIAVLTVVAALRYLELIVRDQQHRIAEKTTAAGMVADLLAGTLSAPVDFGDVDAISAELAHLRTNRDIVYAAVFVGGALAATAEVAAGNRPPLLTSGGGEALVVADDRVEVSRAIVGRGVPVGRVVIVFSLAREHASQARARLSSLGWTALMAIAVGVVLVGIARQQVVVPLARVVDAVGRLARGEPGARVKGHRNDELGRLVDAFNAMGGAIEDRERRLEAATKNLRDLFDHMRQAIVAFGPDGRVVGEASRRANELFGSGASLTGRPVRELIYGGLDPFDADVTAFDEWRRYAFELAPMEWHEIAGLAPDEAVLRRGARDIPLELEFRPIVEDGKVSRIMLLATDVSEQRNLAQRVQTQQEQHELQLQAIRRMLVDGSQVFVTFLDGARGRIERSEELVREAHRMLRVGEIDELFRHVHSVKGEARTFQLAELDAAAATLESRLDALRSQARRGGHDVDDALREELLGRIAALRDALDRGCQLIVEASPLGAAVLTQVPVQRDDLEALLALAKGQAGPLRDVAVRLASRPFGELVASLGESVATWADREGKRAQLVIDGRDVPVPPEVARVLGAVLAHLARNAVAHGIEAKEERELRGKPVVGTVRCGARASERGVSVVVEDDGRGLDVPRIVARAHELGLADRGVEELVFFEGLSTRDEADTLAGRGVGMAAVRVDLESVGYQVKIEFEAGKFTRVVFSPAELAPTVPS